LLVGHSKGALQIGNAIGSLPPEMTENLDVVTMGCPIAEDVRAPRYPQFLGIPGALGQLNMWGNWPEHWTWGWHTTNPLLPPAMNVRRAVDERGSDLHAWRRAEPVRPSTCPSCRRCARPWTLARWAKRH
jgi:hypothetical protein